MITYRRRLPHIDNPERPVFLTWRLHGSLPAHRCFVGGGLSSGRTFAALDRLLDHARTGPFYLRQSEIAEIVVDAILHNGQNLKHYALHAYVVMPNHVHMLATAAVPISVVTKSLKGITAKRANALLRQTGRSFWQEESYDHLVKNRQEFEKIRTYIEENPVHAGLVARASEYRWSSAWATRGSPADEGVRPTSNHEF